MPTSPHEGTCRRPMTEGATEEGPEVSRAGNTQWPSSSQSDVHVFISKPHPVIYMYIRERRRWGERGTWM